MNRFLFILILLLNMQELYCFPNKKALELNPSFQASSKFMNSKPQQLGQRSKDVICKYKIKQLPCLYWNEIHTLYYHTSSFILSLIH